MEQSAMLDRMDENTQVGFPLAEMLKALQEEHGPKGPKLVATRAAPLAAFAEFTRVRKKRTREMVLLVGTAMALAAIGIGWV
jgi:hypothetical protein